MTDSTWGDDVEEGGASPSKENEGVVDNSADPASEILSAPIPSQLTELIKGSDSEHAGYTPEDLSSAANMDSAPVDRNILADIPQKVLLLAGKTKVPFGDIQRWNQGTVVEFDAKDGDPYIIAVGGVPIAKGDAVLINDKLGIRLTEILNSKERLETKKEIF